MSPYLLDTDHFTLLEFGHPPLLNHLLTRPETEIAISVITVEEALRGRLAILSRAINEKSIIEA